MTHHKKGQTALEYLLIIVVAIIVVVAIFLWVHSTQQVTASEANERLASFFDAVSMPSSGSSCGSGVVDPGEDCDPPGGDSTYCPNPGMVCSATTPGLYVVYPDEFGICDSTCHCEWDPPSSSSCSIINCGAECETSDDCGGGACVDCQCV